MSEAVVEGLAHEVPMEKTQALSMLKARTAISTTLYTSCVG